MRLRSLIGILLLATVRRLLQPGDGELAATGIHDRLEAEEELLRRRELYRDEFAAIAASADRPTRSLPLTQP